MTYTRAIEDIPSGAKGLARKTRRIRELVERAKRDPNFRGQVARILRSVTEKDHWGEIQAVVEFVRGRVRYLRDPWSPTGLELFTDPRTLLRDALRGEASGDCDDHVILASAMLETAGYETRYPVGAAGPEDYRHIWLEVLQPRAGWVSVDLTAKEQEIGWSPGDSYHHVETHTGRGETMHGLGNHAPPALPRSFHNVYAEPGIYVGSTPSDFFRAVAMRGKLPQGDAYTLLGPGHNPSDLGGWLSDVADKVKGYVKEYAPIVAGAAGTVIGGPGVGVTAMNVAGALTSEGVKETKPALSAAPMGTATQAAGGSWYQDSRIVEAELQRQLAAKQAATAESSAAKAEAAARAALAEQELQRLSGGGGGFNPLWLAAIGLPVAFLLLRR